MKRLIVGLLAGAVLASAGTGVAMTQAGNVWTSQGITCRSAPAGGGTGAMVACIRSNRTGYVVSITQRSVVVATVKGKVVFGRRQP